MMGHKDKLKTGDEYDMLFWKKVLPSRSGKWKKIKNQINRRIRRNSLKGVHNDI